LYADVYLCSPARQQQLEQERRDRELALRLVAEDQSQVEEVQSGARLVLWFLRQTYEAFVGYTQRRSG
jgi:hypothetical protein